MSEESTNNIFLVTLGIAAIVLASSFLVAAINLGGAVAAGVIGVFFQVIITLAGTAVVVAIAGSIAFLVYSGLVTRVSALESSHGELLKKINKRSPSFATSAALIASLVLLLADKSFKGETVPTICVGIVLILLFWIANELLIAESRVRKGLGVMLWVAALLVLPVSIYFYNHGDITAILSEFSGMGITVMLLVGLAFLVACFAPIALNING